MERALLVINSCTHNPIKIEEKQILHLLLDVCNDSGYRVNSHREA